MNNMIPTPSRIDAVTVYRCGAKVVRVVDLGDAATCPESLIIAGLPLSLVDSSVQVQVTGGPGLVATRVHLGLDLAAGSRDPELPPALPEDLRAARRRLAALEDTQQHLEAQRQRLAPEIAVYRPEGARGEPPPPAPFAGRQAVRELRRELLEELDRRALALRGELRGAREAAEALELREREASTVRRPETHALAKTATIHLRRDPEAAGPRELRLEYRIPGARWAPAYAITLDPGMTSASVALRAVVAQRSGEDWQRVRLTLSTADPERWTELPELPSLRIGRRQAPPLRRGWRAPPAGAEALYGDYDRFVAREAVAPRSATKPPPALGRPEPVWAEAEAELAEELAEDRGLDQFKERSPSRAQSRKRKAPPRPASRGMPPPPPSAPPPPMAAMAPPRGGPGGAPAPMFGSTARSSSSGGAPPPQAEGAAYGKLAASELASELAAPGAPAEPGELLAYSDLRMPPATADGRGRLSPLGAEDRVREQIMGSADPYDGAEVGYDDPINRKNMGSGAPDPALAQRILGELGRAQAQADAAGAHLPPGHRRPAAVDGFDYAYLAEGAVDLASDGEYHGISLLARGASASLTHVVVPRESADAFRVITLANPLGAPLLAGPAEVYVGGTFLLSTDLPQTPVAGELRLGLGVEQAIKVSRNTTYAEESAGMLSGSLLLKHRITVDLANRLGRAVRLEVRERIPSLRPGEDEITLEVGPVNPRWEPYEPDSGVEATLKGGYRWRLELPAGGERRVDAAYTLRISSKKELEGGNRREVGR